MKTNTTKKLALLFSLVFSLPVLNPMATAGVLPPYTNTGAPPFSDTCIDISDNANGGSDPYSVEIPIPDGGPVNLTFTYDMYGIPDTLKVLLAGSTGSKVLVTSQELQYDGSYEWAIPSGRNRSVTIFINEAGGLDGTAWEYQLRGGDVTRLSLNTSSSNEAHDGAQYLSQFQEGRESVVFKSLEAGCVFEVPSGAKALRVWAPASFAIYLGEGCPPDPQNRALKPNFASENRFDDNWIIFAAPAPGKYGVTLRRFINSPIIANLRVDVLLGGKWITARRVGSGVIEQALVGVESPTSTDPALSSPRWLVSHGNLSSPFPFQALGDAIKTAFPSENLLFINWSQGSQARGLNIVASQRWTTDNAIALRSLLGTFGNTKWVGHSFGTWLGYEVGRHPSKFDRIYALDPANSSGSVGEGRYRGAINFRNCATYSVGIVAHGTFGDHTLAKTAHDTVYIDNSLSTGDAHGFPYAFLEQMIERNIPIVGGNNLLDYLLPPPYSPIAAAKPWQNNPFLDVDTESSFFNFKDRGTEILVDYEDDAYQSIVFKNPRGQLQTLLPSP